MIENCRTEFEQIVDNYLKNLMMIVGVGGFATSFTLLSMPNVFAYFCATVYTILGYQLGRRYRAALNVYGKNTWSGYWYMFKNSWLAFLSLTFMYMIAAGWITDVVFFEYRFTE